MKNITFICIYIYIYIFSFPFNLNTNKKYIETSFLDILKISRKSVETDTSHIAYKRVKVPYLETFAEPPSVVSTLSLHTRLKFPSREV